MTVAVLAMSAAGVSLAQDAARPTVVLDTSGFWRAYYTLRTPVILNDGGKAEPLPNPCETPFPADGWRQTDFDDSTWPRLPGAPFPPVRNSWANLWKWNVGGIYMHNSTPALGLICMRGKFHVDDPGKVDGLTLSIAYRGGAVIYLNGREIVRGYLPKGKLTFATLAEVYPDEAYLYPDGSLLDHDYRRAPEVEKRYKQRNRRLEGVGVPVALLRRGTNVLAVQIHRSPYPALMRDRFAKKREGRVDSRLWDNCGLHSLRLTARTSDGLTPNVTRPGGVQVWNGDVLAADFDIDFGDPTEPLKPVTIVGTRNGVFSGKVIVGSTGPMKRFRATVGELRSRAGAKVPAAAVRIRYALPTGHEAGANARYPVSASRFDALDESGPTGPDGGS